MAGELLHLGWLTDGFRDDRQLEYWRSRTRTQVENYAEGLDPADEPLGVERTVAARTGRLAISGRVDRIDERIAPDEGDGSERTEAVIIDYKTGRRELTETDARGSLALALYALSASATLRRPCHTVELHHLPSGTVASWRHDDAGLDRHLRRAESIAAEAQEAEQGLAAADATGGSITPALSEALFPARPGSLCSWCDFRMHCPEGQQAAPTKPPWAALEEPSLAES
jgi:RecB family exonuclease